MEKSEFYDKERVALRDELQNLRNQQITFLTTSVTVSGLVLGVATSLASAPDLGIIFLFPLIVLLPSWWIFFDKATTITRIVGYYRILERLILKHCEASNFVGWENAIGEFRKRKARGELSYPKKIEFKERFSHTLEMLSLRVGNRYWVLCYYIFFALSAVCIMVSAVTLKSTWYVIIVPVALFLVSALWNSRVMWQLIYESHSYDYYENCWIQILRVREITKNE